MKLTSKSEYACLALIELSHYYNKMLVKIDDISKRQKIPKKFLEQILLQLKNAGYVKSKRGATGGYSLSKSPEKITVAEIIRLLDGALAPVNSASQYFYNSTPIEKNDNFLKLFKDIRNYISHKLENTTFFDLL